MIRIALSGLLMAGSLWGLTLQEIGSKPSGHAKNFLIWQFLQQKNVTPDDARRAFEQVANADRRLYMAYAQRSGDAGVEACARCWDLAAKDFSATKDDDCVLMALSPAAVSSLELEERARLYRRFKKSYAAPWLAFMATTTPKSDLSDLDPKRFVQVANAAGSSYRHNVLERHYSSRFIDAVAPQSGFSQLVKLVVTDETMVQFQQSLLQADYRRCDAQGAFFLALNQLNHGNEKAALEHLEYVYDKSYYRMDKDKALFWQYLISKKAPLLQALAQSIDINIYSLYAREQLGQEADNYFITLSAAPQSPQVDITDPFEWEALLGEIRATPKEALFSKAREYRSGPLLPVQAFILERAYGYKMHGYILPYAGEMTDMASDKKAMMLSLMRQESHFIPSALSRSFAMGLMQIMPFLVASMDKQAKREVGSLNKMFDPKTNIAYASEHLDYLQKYLFHPLFVAYAYNGGIGFTKRMLLGGAFSKGDYEPFMSMELMANTESREYGKKVLANYVLYKRILGEKVSMAALFDTLTQPSRTDRFRVSK